VNEVIDLFYQSATGSEKKQSRRRRGGGAAAAAATFFEKKVEWPDRNSPRQLNRSIHMGDERDSKLALSLHESIVSDEILCKRCPDGGDVVDDELQGIAPKHHRSFHRFRLSPRSLFVFRAKCLPGVWVGSQTHFYFNRQ
jgi:hypothetical protein